jgi:hypothetical protein
MRKGASDSEQLPGTTVVTPCSMRRERVRVEAQLSVVVRVRVDEPGGDDLAGGIEHAVRLAGAAADGHHLAVADGDVAVARRAGPSRRRSDRYG